MKILQEIIKCDPFGLLDVYVLVKLPLIIHETIEGNMVKINYVLV